MSNEDSPFVWAPEMCQFASAGDCLEKFGQYGAAAMLVSHYAYEAIKVELADCIKSHDENIDVLKTFQNLLIEAKDELEKLR